MNINLIHPIPSQWPFLHPHPPSLRRCTICDPSHISLVLRKSPTPKITIATCYSSENKTPSQPSRLPATMDSSSDLSDLSSELSSLSRSPSPPTFYPSPEPSQTRDSSVSSKQDDSSRKHSRDREDEDRPKKKRKSAEAKPRTTVHLDLRSPPRCPGEDQSEQLALLLKVLRKRRKIVVIAGAGISTSAGGECASIPALYTLFTNG